MRYRGAMSMRLAEFHRLIAGEFGDVYGRYLVDSHVLAGVGVTAAEAMERGDDLRRVWWALCDDFEVPEERRLGADE